MLALLVATGAVFPQLGWRAGTPEPVLADNPRWVQLYWKAWENLQAAVIEEKEPGPLPPRSIGVDGAVRFDETLALALYARWAWRANPICDTVSYILQNLGEGGEAPAAFTATGAEGSARGIPLAALAVSMIFELTGDREMLIRQLSGARRRHDFFRAVYSYIIPADEHHKKPRTGYKVPPAYSAVPGASETTNEVTAEACGLLLQDAASLAKLYRWSGSQQSARTSERLAEELAKTLASLWDVDERRFKAGDGPVERETLFPLFATISGKAPLAKNALRALFDPERFYRRALFPTVSKDDPSYSAASGVRPLYAYLCLRALIDNGMQKEAGRAAEQMLAVMDADAGAALNLYDAYGPETREPAPGFPPGGLEAGTMMIGGLIEGVLGINVDAASDKVTWFIRRTDKHGLKNLRIGKNVMTLIFENGQVAVDCGDEFNLEVTFEGRKQSKRFSKGNTVWQLSG
jgi:hypothetical protein